MFILFFINNLFSINNFFLKNITKTQKGFTLIELLVLITIIGILAGILFVSINPKAQTDKAQDAKNKAIMANLRTQASLYFGEYCDYFGVLGDDSNPNINTDPKIKKLLDGLKGYWAGVSDKNQ